MIFELNQSPVSIWDKRRVVGDELFFHDMNLKIFNKVLYLSNITLKRSQNSSIKSETAKKVKIYKNIDDQHLI
jgi:hypothetical protein